MTLRTITSVKILDVRVTRPASAASFSRGLKGKKIEDVTRRGKYLRFELDSGETLVIHLRMTGRLSMLRPPLDAAKKEHLRMTICLDDGEYLAFHDTRRFGTAIILKADEAESYWGRLGPEPLERSFDTRMLAGILRGRNAPVKSVLLDQHRIAGIGNIYADEALFRAGIHPLRPAGNLDSAETGRLVKAIKETLRSAIRLEGSSIDSYRNLAGRKGRFQETLRVHRRAGEACPGCGGVVEKIRVGGRGTYFCPACQRLK